MLTVLAVVCALAAPAFAQGRAAEEPCPGSGAAPTPTAVAVTTVPIVVASTPEEYFVLYVRHDVDGTTVEVPVLVKRGEAGTTTLAENVAALPKERYRVEKYLVADPADVDGDCIDDLTELADPVGMNPVNPAAALALTDGAVAIPDVETFETLSLYGSVKFIVVGIDTDQVRIYFANTETYEQHADFLEALGYEWYEAIDGSLTYAPDLVAPDGNPGVYYYYLEPSYSFSLAARFYTVLAASMPLLEGQPGLSHKKQSASGLPVRLAALLGFPRFPSRSRGTSTPKPASWH